MDSNGNKKLIMEKREEPHSISGKEKDFIVNGLEEHLSRRGTRISKKIIEEACQFSPYRPFFNRIFVDDLGRIYIQKMKSVLDKSKEFEFDIFGRDGIYLYKMKLPFTPQIIRSGDLFSIYREEEDGEITIRRYKIKNWPEIRNEKDEF